MEENIKITRPPKTTKCPGCGGVKINFEYKLTWWEFISGKPVRGRMYQCEDSP